jgi:hypothetical protein
MLNGRVEIEKQHFRKEVVRMGSEENTYKAAVVRLFWSR